MMVQDKKINDKSSKKHWNKIAILAKLVITGLILSYIFQTFQSEQKGILDISHSLRGIWHDGHRSVLAILFLLVPFNWALESLKWQILVSKVTKITFWQAFRGTLTGLAVGVAVPAQVGDTIGRLGALPAQNRMKALGAALISNGIQFYVSILGGTLGWILISDRLGISLQQERMVLTILLLLCALGVLIGSFRKKLVSFNPKKTFLIRLKEYLAVVGTYSSGHLALATAVGMVRYLIFLGQFVLALSIFDFPVDIITLGACVSIIFLVKTILPAINVLGDLGVREFTALFVFKAFHLPVEQILAATFLIWIINVLGPIIVGLYLIWKVKIKKNYFDN